LILNDGEFILLSVDDEGSGVPQDISKTYFKIFPKGRINLAELALGFIFAVLQLKPRVAASVIRPVVGGSRFWFRLPQTYSPTSSLHSVEVLLYRLIVKLILLEI